MKYRIPFPIFEISPFFPGEELNSMVAVAGYNFNLSNWITVLAEKFMLSLIFDFNPVTPGKEGLKVSAAFPYR